MSYRSMHNKSVEEWSLDEIRKALLTTDGIGLELKTKAFNRLIDKLKQDSIK